MRGVFLAIDDILEISIIVTTLWRQQRTPFEYEAIDIDSGVSLAENYTCLDFIWRPFWCCFKQMLVAI